MKTRTHSPILRNARLLSLSSLVLALSATARDVPTIATNIAEASLPPVTGYSDSDYFRMVTNGHSAKVSVSTLRSTLPAATARIATNAPDGSSLNGKLNATNPATVVGNLTTTGTNTAARFVGGGVDITGNLTVGGSQTNAGTVAAGTVRGTNIWNPSNVRWYGARGDTNTDDTAAIQAAFDSGIGEIHFPPGYYKTTSTLIITNGLKVTGAGPIPHGTLIYNLNNVPLLICSSPTNGAGCTVLEDFDFVSIGDGIVLDSCHSAMLTRINAKFGTKGRAFVNKGSYNTLYTRCRADRLTPDPRASLGIGDTYDINIGFCFTTNGLGVGANQFDLVSCYAQGCAFGVYAADTYGAIVDGTYEACGTNIFGTNMYSLMISGTHTEQPSTNDIVVKASGQLTISGGSSALCELYSVSSFDTRNAIITTLTYDSTSYPTPFGGPSYNVPDSTHMFVRGNNSDPQIRTDADGSGNGDYGTYWRGGYSGLTSSQATLGVRVLGIDRDSLSFHGVYGESLEIYSSDVSVDGNTLVVTNGNVGIQTYNPRVSFQVGEMLNTLPAGTQVFVQSDGTNASVRLGALANGDSAYGGYLNPVYKTNALASGARLTLGTRNGGLDYDTIWLHNGLAGIGAPPDDYTLAADFNVFDPSPGTLQIRLGYGETYNWAVGRNEPYGNFEIWEKTPGINNLSRFTVKAGGNVGIGTTNPAATLDVNGNIFGTGASKITESVATAPGNANKGGFIVDNAQTENCISFGAYANAAPNYPSYIQVLDDRAGYATPYGLLLQPLGGNVGLGGVIQPEAPLDVAGEIRSSTTITATNGFVIPTNSLPPTLAISGVLLFCDNAATNALCVVTRIGATLVTNRLQMLPYP